MAAAELWLFAAELWLLFAAELWRTELWHASHIHRSRISYLPFQEKENKVQGKVKAEVQNED